MHTSHFGVIHVSINFRIILNLSFKMLLIDVMTDLFKNVHVILMLTLKKKSFQDFIYLSYNGYGNIYSDFH